MLWASPAQSDVSGRHLCLLLSSRMLVLSTATAFWSGWSEEPALVRSDGQSHKGSLQSIITRVGLAAGSR
jgi:hypothetical protein